MKRVNFEMIADSRFCDNIVKEIERLDKGIKDIAEQKGFELDYSPCYFIDFKDTENTKQYRTNYYITKKKEYTYNDIYSAVNLVQATPFNVR